MKTSYAFALCLISSLCITPPTKPMESTTVLWHTAQTASGALCFAIMMSAIKALHTGQISTETYCDILKGLLGLGFFSTITLTMLNAGLAGLATDAGLNPPCGC